MKVQELNEPKFQPLEIKVTIENRRELEFFWAFFNNSTQTHIDTANSGIDGSDIGIQKFSSKEFSKGTLDTTPLWEILNSRI